LAVRINGNRGAQKEISVSTNVSKEIDPFLQEFPIKECDVKNDPIENPESKSDRKIRLRLPVLLGLRRRLLPKTSHSLRLRHGLRNPAC